jgi:hypothetical protein
MRCEVGVGELNCFVRGWFIQEQRVGVRQDALEYFLKELLDFVLCTRGYSCGWGTEFSSCHGMCKKER